MNKNLVNITVCQGYISNLQRLFEGVPCKEVVAPKITKLIQTLKVNVCYKQAVYWRGKMWYGEMKLTRILTRINNSTYRESTTLRPTKHSKHYFAPNNANHRYSSYIAKDHFFKVLVKDDHAVQA